MSTSDGDWPRPEPSSGDEQSGVDRAFAAIMAGYHLTAERNREQDGYPAPDGQPEPPRPEPFDHAGQPPGPSAKAAEPPIAPGQRNADDHALFVFRPSPPPPPEPEERWVAGPPAPLPRPTLPVLLGWVGMGYAVVVVLVLLVGVPLPGWAGWTAIGAFLLGFGVLMLQLPRSRPPDAGDGAVL